MTQDPPDEWRSLDVTADNDLSAKEKETSITFPNDTNTGIIYTDVPTIIKWIQSVEEATPEWVRLAERGAIVGVKAQIPKSIIKLQGNSRQSNAHSNMVSYGDMRE